jgi:hypothetical protein
MKPTRLEYAVLRRTATAINPLLATDAKIDYAPILRGLTTKNFKARKPQIVEGVRKAIAGKTIAKDASVEHLAHMLDQFEHAPAIADESVSGKQHRAMEAAAHGQSNLGIPENVGKEFEEKDKGKTFGDMLRDWAAAKDWSSGMGMSDDDFSALDKLHMDSKEPAMPARDEREEGGEEVGKLHEEGVEDRKARDRKARDRRARDEVEFGSGEKDDEGKERGEDEWEEEKEEEEGEDQLENLGSAAKPAKDRARDGFDKKGGKDRKAKDSALTMDEVNRMIEQARVQERKRAQAKEAAREFVRPYVGKVSLALDTAEAVLRTAAKALNVENADKVHPDALKPLIKVYGERRSQQGENHQSADLAMDSGEDDGVANFNEMFGTDRIKSV